MGTPARGYSWPPFEEGHTLSLKHGLHSRRSIDARAEVVRAELLEALPWVADRRFALALDLCAEQVARAQLAHEAYLVTPGARNLESATAASHRALRSLDELGATPAGFARLKMISAGGAQAEASLADLISTGAEIAARRFGTDTSEAAEPAASSQEALDGPGMEDDSDEPGERL